LSILAKLRTNIPKAISEKVLKEYNNHCARCNSSSPELHHIDEDPSNNEILNLIPLCPNCHQNWAHSSLANVNPLLIKLLRRYKNKKMLANEFVPLLRRLEFLEHIKSMESSEIEKSIKNLLELISHHEKGGFFASQIVDKIGEYPRYMPGFLVYDYVAKELTPETKRFMKQQLDRHIVAWNIYNVQLYENRYLVYEAIDELLSYQNWRDENQKTPN
jgi:hypothetical protein